MAESTKNNSEPTIEGWTQEEKYNLFVALQDVDRKDYEKLHEYVQTKSSDEIKAAIEGYYLPRAYDHPDYKKYLQEGIQATSSKTQKQNPTDILAKWENKLLNSFSPEQLQTDTATALRMTADCEDIPPPAATENIDIREVYRQMANALEGKQLTADLQTTAILRKCITETSLASKAFLKNSTTKQIVQLIEQSNNDTAPTFPKPVEDYAAAILTDLASQTNYNPLNIPFDNLKP